MADQVASLVVEVDASGAKKAAVDLDTLAKAADRADNAANDLADSSRKLSAAEKTVADEVRRASGAVGHLADEQEAAAKTAQRLNDTHGTVIKNTKSLNQATLNLGRQLSDVGVSLAGGASPFMVLVQQGPQVLDIFAQLKTQGVGTGAALRAMAASLAPLGVALAAVAAVAGVAFGAAGLAARELNKDNKNLAAGLGLTEKQMERLKDKGVETGVTIGDVFKGTFNYLKGAAAPVVAPMIKWFGELFDSIAKGSVMAVKAIVGGFAGAFAGVKAIWSDLPAVMNDLFVSGVNLSISAIEKLLNFATAGINKLIEKANAVSGKVGGPQIGTLGGFSLGRVDNPSAGAAAKATDVAVKAVADAYEKAGKGVDKIFGDIGKSIVKAAEDRIKKAAGDAGKTAKGKGEPRDVSEERSAQIAAQIEQALAEELRARLGLTKEVSQRADLERQIATATASAKQARIDGQIAAIADDKGLSALKKAELTLELQRLKFIEGGIADIQRQAISEKERADLAAEALNKAQAGRSDQIDLLESQRAISRTATERSILDLQILKIQQDMERAQLEAIAASVTATEAEKQIAQARLRILGQVQNNQTVAAERDLVASKISDVGDALGDFAKAFDSKVANQISDGFNNVAKAFAQGGPIAAAMAAFSEIGKAVGGKTGAFLQGFGSGGLVGGVLSLFGYNKAKKRARQQAEAERQAEIAETSFQIELDTLRALGKEQEAVNKEREKELARLMALSPALSEAKKAYYAAEDAAAAAAKAQEIANQKRDLEIQLMEATGNTSGALAARRELELAALDESLRAIQSQIYAAQDLAVAQAAAAKAQEDQRGIMLQLMALDDAVTGGNSAVLAARQLELATLDPASRALKEIYFARLDEGEALAKQAAAAEAAAKAQEDLAKAQDEAAKAAFDMAQAYQTTNIGLMRQLMAMDDAVLGTTSARDADRADELAKLDDTGKYLQKIVWAREDEADRIAKQNEAMAKAAELLKQRTDLENQLLVALGMTALATERQRAAMLEGMDPSLRGYQSLLFGVEDATAAVTAAEQALTDARSAASQAYERETSAIQGTIDKFKSFSASLRGFRSSLDTGGLAMNDPMTQYARTKADFERVAGLAASGNEDALGSLQGVSEAYLEASKNAQATNVGYFKDLAAVKRATEAAQKYADQQVDQGTAQLNALNAQVSALGILNQSTLSVGQAVTNVAAAIDALARATAAKAAADAAAKQALSSAGVIPKASESIAIAANDNADLAAAKAIYLSATGGISSELFNRYVGSNPFATFNRLGYDGDPEALRKKYGFATGGSFTVGGSGPPDSQVFPLHLSPGEMVKVSRPGESGNAELVAELRALRQEVADLRAHTKRGADAAQDSALVLDGVARGQLTFTTEAA